MSDQLFDIQPSLSPKLKWLAQHDLVIKRLESGRFELRLDDENFARGETEEEACADFCIKTKLHHWTQEYP